MVCNDGRDFSTEGGKLEGRSRPLSAKPVFGPAFTPGSAAGDFLYLSTVSRVHAAPAAATGSEEPDESG
jgi:hypothetical protein